MKCTTNKLNSINNPMDCFGKWNENEIFYIKNQDTDFTIYDEWKKDEISYVKYLNSSER